MTSDEMARDTTLSQTDSWASVIAGALLAMYGIRQRSIGGAILAAGGGALIFRGARALDPQSLRRLTGSRPQSGDTTEALAGSGGVLVDVSTTIARPQDELYRFWRQLENLPRFMTHLVSVTEIDARRSHWVAKAPAGRTVEWDAEIINDEPDGRIAWRTLEGSDVVSAGSVAFEPLEEGETIVQVRLQYDPPAGKLGSAIAWMFGEEPSQTIREDLERFKTLMEKRASGRQPSESEQIQVG